MSQEPEIDPDILALLEEGNNDNDNDNDDPMEEDSDGSKSDASDSNDSDAASSEEEDEASSSSSSDDDEDDSESSDEDSESEAEEVQQRPKKKLKTGPKKGSPEDWVGKKGTRVRNLDDGDHQFIRGVVTKYIPPIDDDDAPFWFFEHEDGDGEELELDEVKAAVKLFKEQPATKNARQILSETVYALGTEYTARFNEIVWWVGGMRRLRCWWW